MKPYLAKDPARKRQFSKGKARTAAASDDLPVGWEEMPLGVLWQKLNDPRRGSRAAQSIVDAVLYELRTHGLPQLAKPATQQRLSDLSSEQLRDVIAALNRLRPRYRAITDTLLLKLEELL